MTTTRQLLIDALEGETPARTPLAAYNWMIEDPEADDWRRLFDLGLGVVQHCEVIKAVEHGVEDSHEQKTEGGNVYDIYRKKTPVGTLEKVTMNGWHHQDWIKSPEDYKIRQWIVENTELVPDFEEYERADAIAGDHGLPVMAGSGNWLSRTPAMSINVDWAGTERFCMDLAMELPELFELYEAQKKLFLEETHIMAKAPGRFVKWLENLTISMIGPRRYGELLMPVYEEAAPILEAGGKRIMVHYDGALRVIADQIARAPFHIVESLTEPPEGDMLYDECRHWWPDKAFWGNINLDVYELPEAELRQAVIEKRARAGKRAFAFEISEDLPENFRKTIPIILDALTELS